MSKTDAIRAMKQARAAAAAAAAPARPAPAPRTPATPRAAAPAGASGEPLADLAPEALCGHQAIGGKRCTRPQGHAEKNHRYAA